MVPEGVPWGTPGGTLGYPWRYREVPRRPGEQLGAVDPWRHEMQMDPPYRVQMTTDVDERRSSPSPPR